MKFLTDQTLLYWITGFVALACYWMMKPKDSEAITIKNVILSALLVFLGLALGVTLQGTDPGGMAITYAVTMGLSGGSTVKTFADRKAVKAAKHAEG